MLTVSHLTKRYGSRTAVNDISFTVPAGTVLALLGENGAGKTTAVRCMCGLLTPDGGEILYETAAGLKKPGQCREIFGLSPQENAVGLHLTAEENLRLMADLYGVPDPEKRTAEMLSLFGLEAERRTRGRALSGGTGRRLSIAMAMLSSPSVLFLDEPTLGLDVMSRRELWRILDTLRGNMTVIMTTHYMEEAEALADRIAVMKKGKIAAMGSLDDLRRETGLPGGSLEEVFVRIMEGGTV